MRALRILSPLLLAALGACTTTAPGDAGNGTDEVGAPPAPSPSLHVVAPLASALPATGNPTSATAWAKGSLHWLVWAGSKPAVRFEQSTDGGQSWTDAPAEPLSPFYPADPHRQLWRVPDVASVQVRAVAADGDASSPVALTPSPSQAASYAWMPRTLDAGFVPRDGAALEVVNGALLLLGGWNEEVFDVGTTNEVLRSADGSVWASIGHAPWEARHTFGTAQLGGKLFVLGGDPLQGYYQPDVWATTDGTSWQPVTTSAPWGERVLHYAVAHAGALWVMGGQTFPEHVYLDEPVRYFDDVWRSTDGATWTRVLEHAPWPARGAICGHAVFHDEIWVVGGGTYETVDVPDRTLYADAWSSPDGVTWKRHTDPPWHPREYHSVAVWDGRLWVVGGYTWDVSSNHNDVWYTADGENWYEVENSPWPERHAGSLAATADGLVYGAALTGGPTDFWRLSRAP